MEAALIDRWLAGFSPIGVYDDASVAVAREAVRAAGEALGLERTILERLVTATSELAHNQLRHAIHGRVGVREVTRGGVRGLEVVAADRGPGLPDAATALEGGVSTAGGLGQGLASVHRLVDELDLDVRLGEGLCVRARVFASPPPWRSDVGIVGRAFPGEAVSGDDALVHRGDTSMLLALVDGLGHGPQARDASSLAMDEVLAHPGRDLEGQVRACGAALGGGRGAVMGLVRVDWPAASAEQLTVGNILVHRYRGREVQRFGSTPGFLSSPELRRRTLRSETTDVTPGDLVVLASDGLTTRVDLTGDPLLQRRHPIFVAEALLARYGRPDDDALVMVAR